MRYSQCVACAQVAVLLLLVLPCQYALVNVIHYARHEHRDTLIARARQRDAAHKFALDDPDYTCKKCKSMVDHHKVGETVFICHDCVLSNGTVPDEKVIIADLARSTHAVINNRVESIMNSRESRVLHALACQKWSDGSACHWLVSRVLYFIIDSSTISVQPIVILAVSLNIVMWCAFASILLRMQATWKANANHVRCTAAAEVAMKNDQSDADNRSLLQINDINMLWNVDGRPFQMQA